MHAVIHQHKNIFIKREKMINQKTIFYIHLQSFNYILLAPFESKADLFLYRRYNQYLKLYNKSKMVDCSYRRSQEVVFTDNINDVHDLHKTLPLLLLVLETFHEPQVLRHFSPVIKQETILIKI